MKEAAYQFCMQGTPIACQRHGNGHINSTYRVETDSGKAYILQRINQHVFTNVPALMENIAAVTEHLARGEGDPRRVLTLVPTKEGKTFWQAPDGECWRAYVFIEDSICLDAPACEEDFRQSGAAFGGFQNALADFPAHTLHETIARFHDTPNRYAQLQAALDADAMHRAQDVRREIDFAMARREEAGAMVKMGQSGALPLRVTHNDTKLNNVMLDAQTRKALCVIDLDTVMPGLAGNDFGDSIRFGASTVKEDEPDWQKTALLLPMYTAYAEGFLRACGGRLTQAEIDTLPMGAKLMTLECGVRFLADYLAGDVYFHIEKPAHNLDRCRTQFALVADMENKWDAMRSIVEGIAR